MRRSGLTQKQIIGVLREHQAGAAAPDLCRRHGVSKATFYTWRSKYGGMEVLDARTLKGFDGRTPGSRSCWPSRCWTW